MPFQSAPNCTEIVIDYLFAGAATANVLHAVGTSPLTQAGADLVALAIDAIVGADAADDFTAANSYVGTRVRGLTLANDVQSAASVHAGAGIAMDRTMPNNVSLCLTMRTGSTGRSARGRFYCQPPKETQMLENNTVNAEYIVERLAFVNRLLASLASLTLIPCVLSRHTAGALRPVGVAFPITRVEARNSRTDSQRGRMPSPS